MSGISARAHVEPGALIGAGSTVWDAARVRAGAVVGRECVVGNGAFIDVGVRVGDHCKIQNNALIYSPAVLGNGAFIGPAAVLTNDRFPRAVNPDGTLKSGEDWTPEGVEVGDGASIGACSTIVAGVRIGAWALVAAGSVVTSDVPPYALVAGVPARRIAWVGPAGRPLEGRAGRWVCPITGTEFAEIDGMLEQA